MSPYPLLASFGGLTANYVHDIDACLHKDFGVATAKASKGQIMKLFMSRVVIGSRNFFVDKTFTTSAEQLLASIDIDGDVDLSCGTSPVSGKRKNSVKVEIPINETIEIEVSFLKTASIGYGDDSDGTAVIHHIHSVMVDSDTPLAGFKFDDQLHRLSRLIDCNDFQVYRIDVEMAQPTTHMVLTQRRLDRILEEQLIDLRRQYNPA